MDASIYWLLDIRGPLEVRYVGKTTKGLQARLARHAAAARRGSSLPVHCWMRKIATECAGRAPVIVEVARCDEEFASEIEIEQIAWLREQGARLLNCTAGGDGMSDPGPETRVKLGASKRGVPLSSEHRSKLSAAKLGKALSEEHCAKISAALRGRSFSPETRAKMSAASRGRGAGVPKSPEHRARISAGLARAREKALAMWTSCGSVSV